MAGVEQGLVQGAVETITGDLVRHRELLDQHEGLDAGVKVRGVCNTE